MIFYFTTNLLLYYYIITIMTDICLTKDVLYSTNHQVSVIILITVFFLFNSILTKLTNKFGLLINTASITINMSTLLLSVGFMIKINVSNTSQCTVEPDWFEIWYLVCETLFAFGSLIFVISSYGIFAYKSENKSNVNENGINEDVNDDDNILCLDLSISENKKFIKIYNLTCSLVILFAWALTLGLTVFLCNPGDC